MAASAPPAISKTRLVSISISSPWNGQFEIILGFPFWHPRRQTAYTRSHPLVLFFVLSMPRDSGGPRRGQSRAAQVLENQELPYFKAISPTSLCLSLISTYSLASRA